MGFALVKYQKTTPLSSAHKAYLRDFFNEGQRTKRKMAGAAAAALKNMREDPSFAPPYPLIQQIKTFFSKCYAAIKHQTVNDEGIAVVPIDASLDGEATPEEEIDFDLIETTIAHNDIISAMVQEEQDDDGSNDTHPLEENHIDLCAIAVDYQEMKGSRGKLYIDDYNKDEIKAVMERLDIRLPNKMTGRSMARAIYNYVSTTCPDQCTSQNWIT